MFQILFFLSTVDRHLGLFYFLTIMNNTTINICVQVSVWICAFIFSQFFEPNSSGFLVTLWAIEDHSNKFISYSNQPVLTSVIYNHEVFYSFSFETKFLTPGQKGYCWLLWYTSKSQVQLSLYFNGDIEIQREKVTCQSVAHLELKSRTSHHNLSSPFVLCFLSSSQQMFVKLCGHRIYGRSRG